ncbi:hypothetical protein PLICRDRAFT_138550 [Plicaturopsis crispa FD-325 SS-3]|nr:hypothetical protein PLICRDRAFT_138550 [Plicaturopsis crispa FD-325 SS-3]
MASTDTDSSTIDLRSEESDSESETSLSPTSYDLTPAEEVWRSFCPHLARLGYDLRPRYRPGWVPSWTGTQRDPRDCEDSYKQMYDRCLDAVRISDGAPVYLKLVEKDGSFDETGIHQYLDSSELRRDPRNHTVPIIEIIDTISNTFAIVVMPMLRIWDDPPFLTLGEVCSFVQQFLEGVEFMHSHNVAHRDLSVHNILVDATKLIPNGFNPLINTYGIRYPKRRIFQESSWKRSSRTCVSPKYYIIDFGVSTRFPSSEERHLVKWQGGRGFLLPECRPGPDTLYDPFKGDIHALGEIFGHLWFQAGYPENLVMLRRLADDMTADDPAARPDARQCLETFCDMTHALSAMQLRAPIAWLPNCQRSFPIALIEYLRALWWSLFRKYDCGEGCRTGV